MSSRGDVNMEWKMNVNLSLKDVITIECILQKAYLISKLEYDDYTDEDRANYRRLLKYFRKAPERSITAKKAMATRRKNLRSKRRQ